MPATPDVEARMPVAFRPLVILVLLASGSLLAAPENPPATRPADPGAVKSFVYQLQKIDPAAIAQTKFDLAVIDYSADGSDDKRFSAAQIKSLRESPARRKIVLSYLSIGEAEDYRWYWKRAWKPAPDGKPPADAPSWLGPEDPDWHGNYKVRYWDPAWQAIVRQYVDKIIATGFDGVYLDIIDAYEFWGPDGPSGLKRKTAEREMIDFVKSIAKYAREDRGVPQFLVFVQNCEELGKHPDYLAAVSGIGREDTWYNGNKPNKASDIAEILANLDRFKDAGKPVLCIDYVTREKLIDDFYAKAAAKGYVPYANVRQLDRLTINKGHEP
jgi:cysteinyl-tRNA synthetase